MRTQTLKQPRRPERRGIATLWAVLTIPIMLVMLCGVIHIANLWLARVELENALEAAALAAVKEWGDANGGATDVPREIGVAYAGTNTTRRMPVEIATNLHPNPSEDNPNANLACAVDRADPSSGTPPTGNLIFGAITDDDPLHPITFNAGVAGGCLPALVSIDVTKPDAGSGNANSETHERMFGIFFDEGPSNLSIRSVSFTIPVLRAKNLSQQPYFDADKRIVLSVNDMDADSLNRDNPDPQPKDVRGLDPTPVTAPDNWLCPQSPPGRNPNGDACFTLADQVVCKPCGDDRFRTLTIHFRDGAFTTTNDRDTTDFIRFGASVNQLNPPAIPGPGSKNDGEAFRKAPVRVTVVFYNTTTGTTVTGSGVFVDDDDPNNGRAVALIGGAGGGTPAVRARAIVPVPSLYGRLFGIGEPAYVSACVTAVYDCELRRPRLIRVDRFICPGPNP